MLTAEAIRKVNGDLPSLFASRPSLSSKKDGGDEILQAVPVTLQITHDVDRLVGWNVKVGCLYHLEIQVTQTTTTSSAPAGTFTLSGLGKCVAAGMLSVNFNLEGRPQHLTSTFSRPIKTICGVIITAFEDKVTLEFELYRPKYGYVVWRYDVCTFPLGRDEPREGLSFALGKANGITVRMTVTVPEPVPPSPEKTPVKKSASDGCELL